MWLDDDDRMGWDGVYRHRHHIIAIYMKHDTINNQPTKETRCNNNNNILQIHFYDDTPLFLRTIMSFFGWMDGERRKERGREKERII